MARPPSHAPQVRLENSRLAKWHKMLSIASGELPPQQTLPAGTRRLLAKRVPKGVPDPLRGTVWCALSGAQALMDERPGAYAALKRRAAVEGSLPEAVAAQIDNDLQRTYPEHFGGALEEEEVRAMAARLGLKATSNGLYSVPKRINILPRHIDHFRY